MVADWHKKEGRDGGTGEIEESIDIYNEIVW